MLIASLLLGSCAAVQPGGSARRSLPPGQWGGDQIELTVDSSGNGKIELSCAAADFSGPVMLDSAGNFLVVGHFSPGMGPARLDPPPPLPATIAGRLDPDGTLRIDIALSDSTPVRAAALRPGADPHLMRCL